jgi:hypothetical protein
VFFAVAAAASSASQPSRPQIPATSSSTAVVTTMRFRADAPGEGAVLDLPDTRRE